jgi:hydrogenase/urease accessory protein HupE
MLLFLVPFSAVFADELKPAYAELTQQTDELWRVVWKTSEQSILGRSGKLVLPKSCMEVEQVSTRRARGNLIRTSMLNCGAEFWGQNIAILGLERTNTDALIRVSALSGQQTLRLTPRQPFAVLVQPKGSEIRNVAAAYTVLGVEHILQGYDHLLFVIAMVMLVSGWKRIAWTITAFTLAHSITLIGTTFGYLSLPQRPVEAIIALSIVFLAVELVKRRAGQKRLSEAYPWLVAFLFGLLHGFGFAGALAEIGLPDTDVPLALFTFNVGVELGQLAVVGITIGVIFLLRRLLPNTIEQFKTCCGYFIGITSTYWLIERVIL